MIFRNSLIKQGKTIPGSYPKLMKIKKKHRNLKRK